MKLYHEALEYQLDSIIHFRACPILRNTPVKGNDNEVNRQAYIDHNSMISLCPRFHTEYGSPYYECQKYKEMEQFAIRWKEDMDKTVKEVFEDKSIFAMMAKMNFSRQDFTLNLKLPKDLLTFLIIKDLPQIAMSESEINSMKTEFYLYDQEMASKEVINRSERIYEAITIIKNMSTSQRIDFCILLNIAVDESNSIIVESCLQDIATKSPNTILSAHLDNKKELKLFVNKCIKQAIITRNSINSYVYKENVFDSYDNMIDKLSTEGFKIVLEEISKDYNKKNAIKKVQ